MDGAAFDRLLLHTNRNHAPALLFEAFCESVIDDGVVTAQVGPAWCAVEFPDGALDWDGWVAMFDVASYTVDGVSSPLPTDPVQLYRAATVEHREGHSWTEDIDLAKRFLTVGGRSLFPAQIWTATVAPERLRARLAADRTGEVQYVVETAGLIITEVPTARP